MLQVTHAKTTEMLALMREAAAILTATLEMVGEHVRPGVDTATLDRLCHEFIVDHGGVRPASAITAIAMRPASR